MAHAKIAETLLAKCQNRMSKGTDIPTTNKLRLIAGSLAKSADLLFDHGLGVPHGGKRVLEHALVVAIQVATGE